MSEFLGTPAPPPLDGLLETALYVADLDRSERFWCGLLAAPLLLANDRMRALDIGHRQVLLLFAVGGSEQQTDVPGGVIPPHGATGRAHLAFAIGADAVDAWAMHLTTLGISIETEVRPPRGGRCLYFRDPDGHLIELASPGVWSTY